MLVVKDYSWTHKLEFWLEIWPFLLKQRPYRVMYGCSGLNCWRVWLHCVNAVTGMLIPTPMCVGITKMIFTDSSLSPFFRMNKTLVTYEMSSPYLTYVVELSCGDTWRIWAWPKRYNLVLCKINTKRTGPYKKVQTWWKIKWKVS